MDNKTHALKGRKLSDAERAQKAVRRAETKAVQEYLNHLEAQQPKPGRKRDPEKLAARLELVTRALADGFDPDARGKNSGVPLPAMRRLRLIQEKLNLHEEIDGLAESDDTNVEELEEAFVTAAKPWAQRQKYPIGYSALRTFGVSADVLKRAGFKRSN